MFSDRKSRKGVDVPLKLMDLIFKAGNRGLTFNASLARSINVTPPALYNTVNNLAERGILIVSTNKGHNKTAAACGQIEKHEDWIRAKYGPNVPQRYKEYVNGHTDGSDSMKSHSSTATTQHFDKIEATKRDISINKINDYIKELEERIEVLETVINDQEEIIKKQNKKLKKIVSIVQK